MNALIEFSLRHRVLMLVLFVLMFAGGIVAWPGVCASLSPW